MISSADIYVLVGLLTFGPGPWTFRELAQYLAVPVPLVQRSLGRAAEASLYMPEARRLQLPNLEEFLIHAARFVAPVQLGVVVAGVPAAWAAPPLSSLIVESGDELPPVWPWAHGRVRGQALQPLHASAPEAASRHPGFGEALAVVDSLRAGDLRVRSIAAGVIEDLLRGTGQAVG